MTMHTVSNLHFSSNFFFENAKKVSNFDSKTRFFWDENSIIFCAKIRNFIELLRKKIKHKNYLEEQKYFFKKKIQFSKKYLKSFEFSCLNKEFDKN